MHSGCCLRSPSIRTTPAHPTQASSWRRGYYSSPQTGHPPPAIRSHAAGAPRRPACSSDAAVLALLIAVFSSVGTDEGNDIYIFRAASVCASCGRQVCCLQSALTRSDPRPIACARRERESDGGRNEDRRKSYIWPRKRAKVARRLATRRRGGIVRQARLAISGTPIGWRAAKISEGPASDRGGRGGRRKRDEEMTSHRVQPTGDKIRVAG